MTRQPRRFYFTVSAALMMASMAPLARAQGQLDSPTIQVIGVAPSYVALRVTAGPSGTPGGFHVEWTYESMFDALGGWRGVASDPWHHFCDFRDVSTRHAGGSAGYQLGPCESVDIVLGELFDETGVTTDDAGELSESRGVVVRGYAIGDAVRPDSPFTPDVVTATTAGNNCTFTLGYWKTHLSAWPSFSTLVLGTVPYTRPQLVSVLDEPSGGNGLITLAHQLIAAKLNILHGADGSTVSARIADADNLVGGLIVPPVGSGYLSPSATMIDVNMLDAFSNGLAGVGHCGSTPTHHTTWGSVKTLYHR